MLQRPVIITRGTNGMRTAISIPLATPFTTARLARTSRSEVHAPSSMAT